MSKNVFLGFFDTEHATVTSPNSHGNTANVSSGKGQPAPRVVNDKLYIPSGMTSIDAEMFRGRRDFSAICFEEPVTLEKIGWAAFCDCSRLLSIEFPEQSPLREICDDAFRRCGKLHSLTLPKGVERIGENAFGQCGSLSTVSFPHTLKRIERGAFSFCFKLHCVTIPREVSLIGEDAFYLSRARRPYVTLLFPDRKDFSGVHPSVLRAARRCPNCGRPRTAFGRRCICGNLY